MALREEIEAARREIVSDGYEMSIGEIANLYANREIIISPDFQRLFRWDQSRKTRFIESLLLGIPIPPIFVYMNEDGVWELVDGLQRLSTVFEFMGILWDANGKTVPPSVMEGTRFLPSFAGKRYEESGEGTEDGIGRPQQLQIKRARLRVEILKQESDPLAKYELFQRLNTGGAVLSEQEVRNCVAVMMNKPFHEWLVDLAAIKDFTTTTAQTEYALKQQSGIELVLRFMAFRNVSYRPGLDVHEYLDGALLRMATDSSFDTAAEGSVFMRTFSLLGRALGRNAFRKWNGRTFSGKFLMSVYEVVATGVSKNLEKIEAMEPAAQDSFVQSKAKGLWSQEAFQKNSGAGVRGTTRLTNLLPMAEDYLRP